MSNVSLPAARHEANHPASEDEETHFGAGRRGKYRPPSSAVIVIAALGYLAFNYIDHQRKMQELPRFRGAATARTGVQ